MEITLWLIVYLAGVLPVSKAFMIEGDTVSKGYASRTKLSDVIGFGLLWPVVLLGIILSGFVIEPVIGGIYSVLKKLV